MIIGQTVIGELYAATQRQSAYHVPFYTCQVLVPSPLSDTSVCRLPYLRFYHHRSDIPPMHAAQEGTHRQQPPKAWQGCRSECSLHACSHPARFRERPNIRSEFSALVLLSMFKLALNSYFAPMFNLPNLASKPITGVNPQPVWLQSKSIPMSSVPVGIVPPAGEGNSTAELAFRRFSFVPTCEVVHTSARKSGKPIRYFISQSPTVRNRYTVCRPCSFSMNRHCPEYPFAPIRLSPWRRTWTDRHRTMPFPPPPVMAKKPEIVQSPFL